MPPRSRAKRPDSTSSSGRPSPAPSPKLAYKGVTEALHATTTTTTTSNNRSSSVSPLSAPASHPAHAPVKPSPPPQSPDAAKAAHSATTEEGRTITAEDLELTATTQAIAAATTAKAARNKRKREKKKLSKLEARQHPSADQPHNNNNNNNKNHNHQSSKSKKKEKGVAVAPPSQKSLVELKRAFSHIHFEIQMQNDKTGRTTLFPRDLGLLFLWTVPSPIPLVEFPSIFLIKNKSRLKDVLVVYINGWSYDKLMGTGVGLPREAEATEEEPEQRGVTAPEATEDEEGTEARAKGWHQQVCASMLQFVRCNQCWARTEEKVQYAPLIIPNTVNALEQELFWRNDPPRAPGGGRQARAGAEGEGGSPDGAAAVRRGEEKPPPSVAARFHLAKEIHSNQGSPLASNATAAREKAMPPPPPPTAGTAAAAAEGAQEELALWSDHQLLQQYALHWPEHAAELDALGFTLQAPSPPPPPSAPCTAAPAEDTTRAAGKRSREEEGEDKKAVEEDEEGEALLCLQEPWVVLPEDTTTTTTTNATAEKEEQEVEVAIYAFDCEMVLVGRQTSVLGRATLVDVKDGGATVLDVLVRQKDAVTNYVTRYSGLTEEMFAAAEAAREAREARGEGVVYVAPDEPNEAVEKDGEEDDAPPPLPIVSLEEFQAAFAHLVTTHTLPSRNPQPSSPCVRKITYIVGHSLENDFKAGKILPRGVYLLDSAQLYPHPAGLPFKNSLRFLSQRYLRRRIQQGAHDSAEDARASSDLVGLKLRHGPTFGVREKVSVLQWMSHYNYPSSSAPTATTATAPKAVIQLFDDAVTLSHVLPKQAATTAASAAEEAPGHPCEVRLDAIPCRHDDDVTRRVVRALDARRQQHREEAEKSGRDAVEDDAAAVPYSFLWAQLTQTAVDVVRPRRGAAVGEAEIAAHEAEQLRRVADVNDRVRRMIEACPDETLVLLVAGECRGAASGNHFSRAQGAVFGFVKDASAPGPPPPPATTATTTTTTAEEGRDAEPHDSHSAKHTPQHKAAAVAMAPSLEKPPACQPQ